MRRVFVPIFLIVVCHLIVGCSVARTSGKVVLTPVMVVRDVVDLPLAATASALNDASHACAQSPFSSPISLLILDPVSLTLGSADYLVSRCFVLGFDGTCPWYSLSDQEYFLNLQLLWNYEELAKWREESKPKYPTDHMERPYWSLPRIVYTPLAIVRDGLDVPLATLANVTMEFGKACAYSPLTWIPGTVFDLATIAIGLTDYFVCRAIYPHFWRGVSPWRDFDDPLFGLNTTATWAPDKFEEKIRHSRPRDPRVHFRENHLTSMILYTATLPISIVTGVVLY